MHREIPVSQLLGLGLRRALRLGGSALTWTLAWPFALLQSTPTSLSLAPQDIRTADPTIADDIYAGYFIFAGRVVHLTGQSPFHAESPSHEWARNLHSFRWLRHLRAADTALSRLNARALIEDWLNTQSNRNPSPAWEPQVAARRLMSWLSQSPLILEGVDAAFYRRFLAAIGRHVRFLRRCLNGPLSGETRLLICIALTQTALCAEGLERLQKTMVRALARELSRQMLQDGGHVSRNPQILIDLMLDLLPLRQIYIARGLSAATDLQTVLDRILPMLRMFRHADGSIALFQGMGTTPAPTIATLFSHDEAQVQPLLNAEASGYRRLEAGQAVLVLDTGALPPPDFADEAHASILAFEFSHGGQKIFTNCGSAGPTRPALREAGRQSAAHTGVTLETLPTATTPEGVWARLLGKPMLDGPAHVSCEQVETVSATTLAAGHDAYRRSHMIELRRALTLTQDGLSLTGREEAQALRAGAPLPKLIARFHLEPGTQIQQFSDQTIVALHLPDGSIWDFACKTHAIQVEDSIQFADPSGPKPSRQLVIRAQNDTIEWIAQRADAAQA